MENLTKQSTNEHLKNGCSYSDRKGKAFDRSEDNIKKVYVKDQKKDKVFINKEQLKNIKEMEKYLVNNNFILSDNFELINYLDSGGESNVYGINIINKDKNGQIHRKKAVMKAILLHNKEKETRRQIYISNKLKHNNIINLYGFTKLKDDTFLLFMEKARYGHIRNFERKIIQKPNLSESMLCYFSYQILNAIAYSHKCKVAHLDIKLQNIVIDEYLNAKLIDFSISLNYEGKKKNDSIVLPCRGTNFYLPKEILESKKIKIKDLNKVDLYSFGVVLFNLAFSRYPYNLTHGDEDNYDEILRKMKYNEIIFDKGYSPYFIDFLKQLLQTDIDKRIDIQGALNHYWIKGAQLLLDEKDKIYNANVFTSYLMTDHIGSFNEYINIPNKPKEERREQMTIQENNCKEEREILYKINNKSLQNSLYSHI